MESLPVAPKLNQAELQAVLDTFSFDNPGSRIDVLQRFTQELKRHQGHTPHPCYFGLFTPAPTFMGILGESIAATLNPQLAAWSHSPLAVETERRLIDAFASKFGRGRFFVGSDEGGKQEVAIIDETTARRYWLGIDPVGRRLRLKGNPSLPWVTVVGIVKDMKQDGLDTDGVPHIFRPISGCRSRSASIQCPVNDR